MPISNIFSYENRLFATNQNEILEYELDEHNMNELNIKTRIPINKIIYDIKCTDKYIYGQTNNSIIQWDSLGNYIKEYITKLNPYLYDNKISSIHLQNGFLYASTDYCIYKWEINGDFFPLKQQRFNQLIIGVAFKRAHIFVFCKQANKTTTVSYWNYFFGGIPKKVTLHYEITEIIPNETYNFISARTRNKFIGFHMYNKIDNFIQQPYKFDINPNTKLHFIKHKSFFFQLDDNVITQVSMINKVITDNYTPPIKNFVYIDNTLFVLTTNGLILNFDIVDDLESNNEYITDSDVSIDIESDIESEDNTVE
jgi:hypothetical protein